MFAKRTRRFVNSAQRICAMRNVHKKVGGQKYPQMINTCTLDAHPCMYNANKFCKKRVALTMPIIYLLFIVFIIFKNDLEVPNTIFAFLQNRLTTDAITQDIKGFDTNVSLSNRFYIYSGTQLQRIFRYFDLSLIVEQERIQFAYSHHIVGKF